MLQMKPRLTCTRVVKSTQVWKREGRAYNLSSGKVIAWTCMSANGARPVVFLADTTVDSRMNSEVQRAMLSNEI